MCKKNNAFWLSLALFFPALIQAQIFVTDSFTDGNHTTNPAWIGDTQKFEVNASNQLQLKDALANSPAYLVTSSEIINQASWEFWIRMEFPPSGSNYGSVCLVSDNQNLTQSLNGYFVQIGGESGTVDDVSLYRQDGSSSTKLIDGIDGTVALDPVDVKVKVTKDSLGEWELFIDTSTTKNSYVSQGTATDLSHPQSSYFGILCNYTTTRSDKFFFDNISLQGKVFQDTIKPILDSLSVIDSNTLQLLFSEKMETNTATNPSNYIVNKGFGNPATISFPGNDSSLVQLNFSSPFENAEEYYLKVKNVEDRSSNVMETDSLSFLYFQAVPAAYRDLVINEFYPDYNPSLGLPEAEFVEIYNASNKIFDIENWSITDGTSIATLNSHILRPGDYLILCAQSDVSSFQSYGAVLGLSSLPTLNNSGDLIRISDESNQVIDELTYDLSWYQDENKTSGGWTIERINPIAICSGISNFGASRANIGGTPGKQNSIFDSLPDITPPKLLRAEVLSVDSILLFFNERLDTNSVLTATYSFNTNVTIDQIVNRPPDFKSVLLTLSDGLDSGEVNTVTVNGISDCPGNIITNDNEIEVVIPDIPAYRDVVINEFYPNYIPSLGLPEAEFVEIYNASNKIFDVENWSITDGTSTASLNNYILRPGDYLILCAQSDVSSFQSYGAVLGLSSLPTLNNSGDLIQISDENNQVIDELTYDLSWYQDENKTSGGWTIERINPFAICTGISNFGASIANIGGTPGTQNSIFDTLPDTFPPKLLRADVLSVDSILLFFNERLDTNSVLSTTYSFNTNVTIDQIVNHPPDFKSVLLTLSDGLDSGLVNTLTINGTRDCPGNIIDANASIQFVLPQTAAKNDIVINEILFNPRTEGNDFVELYNRSNKILSLQNWQIGNEGNGQVNVITEEPYLLFPNEYLVLTENAANIKAEYSGARGDRIFEMDKLPSYNNDKGEPYLLDNSARLIDRIVYDEEMHFELLREVKGVSLERINPHGASDDASNFHSAAETVGFATPAYKNSQYSLSTAFKGVVNVDPETFSPDNDGFQDLLNINYQFDEPGNVANVRIYDRHGRLIRDLVNNELLGLQGTFKWDGITTENSKARIGVYVIFFEVFNPNGDQKVYKKSAVLAGYLD